MSIDYGDADPEDAYDAGDPIPVRLDVLERIVASLRANRDDRFDARRRDAVRLIVRLGEEDLPRRHRRRLRHIRDELEEL